MTDLSLTYKMVILEFLKEAGFSLTNAQITDFMLETGITNYFSVQEALHDLVNSGVVWEERTNSTTYYSFSKKAQETLSLFQEKISSNVREEIQSYLKDHRDHMQKQNAATSHYQASKQGDYLCTLRVQNEDGLVFSLSTRVPSKAMAEIICTNWKEKYETVSAAIHEVLYDHLIE